MNIPAAPRSASFRHRVAFLLSLAVSSSAMTAPAAPAFPPDESRPFFTLPDGSTLRIDLFRPADWAPGDRRPAAVFFYGGGWIDGDPSRLAPQCRALADDGMVCFAPQYRTRNSHGTRPLDALADARAAMRWVRRHAAELGVDPDRIAAGGGSAGGHLAAACALVEDFDHPGDDPAVSPRPAALVLFNPVLDNGPAGFGWDRVKDAFPAFSPFHHVSAGAPPTVLFLGTEDHLIPPGTLRTFTRSLRAAGGQASLHLYPGQKHGFFNRGSSAEHYALTLRGARAFLRQLGWISPAAPPSLLCVGDSITAAGGWMPHVAAATGWKLINAGRSGRKAADLPAEFPALLAAHPEADRVLLFLGVNDLPARDPRPGAEKVAAVARHLDEAITLALDRFPADRILLAAPCGVHAEALDAVNREKGYHVVPSLLADLEAALRAVAARRGVGFVNLLHAVEPGHYRDGLHPDAAGEADLARALIAHLAQPMPPAPPPARPAFYLVGDSISIDYHAALQVECAGHYDYTRKGGLELARSNLDRPQGANGGDSAMVLAHLRELFASGGPAASTVLFNCGLHDLKTDPATGARQVPLDDYRRNLEAIVAAIRQAGKRPVWITTTPLDEERHQRLQQNFHRHEADLIAYNAVAAEVMATAAVPIIDLHGFTAALGRDIYRDHVHFVPEVSLRQAGFLRRRLDELLADGL